jgi:hypothetical protein
MAAAVSRPWPTRSWRRAPTRQRPRSTSSWATRSEWRRRWRTPTWYPWCDAMGPTAAGPPWLLVAAQAGSPWRGSSAGAGEGCHQSPPRLTSRSRLASCTDGPYAGGALPGGRRRRRPGGGGGVRAACPSSGPSRPPLHAPGPSPCAPQPPLASLQRPPRSTPRLAPEPASPILSGRTAPRGANRMPPSVRPQASVSAHLAAAAALRCGPAPASHNPLGGALR